MEQTLRKMRTLHLEWTEDDGGQEPGEKLPWSAKHPFVETDGNAEYLSTMHTGNNDWCVYFLGEMVVANLPDAKSAAEKFATYDARQISLIATDAKRDQYWNLIDVTKELQQTCEAMLKKCFSRYGIPLISETAVHEFSLADTDREPASEYAKNSFCTEMWDVRTQGALLCEFCGRHVGAEEADHLGLLRYAHFGDRIMIAECPCNTLSSFESWLWSNRRPIAGYVWQRNEAEFARQRQRYEETHNDVRRLELATVDFEPDEPKAGEDIVSVFQIKTDQADALKESIGQANSTPICIEGRLFQPGRVVLCRVSGAEASFEPVTSGPVSGSPVDFNGLLGGTPDGFGKEGDPEPKDAGSDPQGEPVTPEPADPIEAHPTVGKGSVKKQGHGGDVDKSPSGGKKESATTK